MLISVVPIGNSKGIRIPKSILQQLDIKEKVELEVHENEIVIKPAKSKRPREGWYEEFIKMHENGDDKMLIDEFEEQEKFQWDWQ